MIPLMPGEWKKRGPYRPNEGVGKTGPLEVSAIARTCLKFYYNAVAARAPTFLNCNCDALARRPQPMQSKHVHFFFFSFSVTKLGVTAPWRRRGQ